MKWQKAIEELGFGRCRRCERPPDDFLFTEHIYWALCTPSCRTAWWAMFSAHGWGLAEAQVRQAEAELAGWDVADEEKDAYMAGAGAQIAFVKAMGLPWPKDAVRLDLRRPDGTRIHLRTTRFEGTPLVVHASDPGDDVFVLVVAKGPPFDMGLSWRFAS